MLTFEVVENSTWTCKGRYPDQQVEYVRGIARLHAWYRRAKVRIIDHGRETLLSYYDGNIMTVAPENAVKPRKAQKTMLAYATEVFEPPMGVVPGRWVSIGVAYSLLAAAEYAEQDSKTHKSFTRVVRCDDAREIMLTYDHREAKPIVEDEDYGRGSTPDA
jgi:hypothetical protein